MMDRSGMSLIVRYLMLVVSLLLWSNESYGMRGTHELQAQLLANEVDEFLARCPEEAHYERE